jgi:hypothetical protein
MITSTTNSQKDFANGSTAMASCQVFVNSMTLTACQITTMLSTRIYR